MFQSHAAWTDLVGRDKERDALLSFLRRGADVGSALAVAGQSGVGKSVLLDCTANTARSRGYVVWSAAGAEFEAGIAYAALNQLLSPSQDMVSDLPPTHRDVLAAVLGYAPAAGANQVAVAAAVLGLLTRVGLGAPVLLVVDDAQWADRPTGAVLALVARAAIGRRLALLVSYRADELSSVDTSAFDTLDLKPLDPASAAMLLSLTNTELTPGRRRRVLAEAAGNPLALLELPRALGERQHHTQEELPALVPLNRKLRSMFMRRVLDLDVSVRRLLLLAALDGSAESATLAVALDTDEAAFRSGADVAAAVKSGLAATHPVDGDDGDGTRLVFRHPLVRATVVEVSSTEERQGAHAALARAYVDRPETRAWHLAEATSRPNETLAELLERTAFLELARGGAVGAVNRLVRAAELSESATEQRRRLAHAAYLATDLTGDLARGAALLAEARRGQPGSPDPLQVGVAAAHMLLIGDGDVDSAHRLLVATIRAWSTANTSDSRALLAALYTLFDVCIYSARPEFWPPLSSAVDALDAVPIGLHLQMNVLADPVRATQAALNDVEQAVAQIEQGYEHDPATIERVATVALFVDRMEPCSQALQRLAADDAAAASAVTAGMLLMAEDFLRGRWDSCARHIGDALDRCDQHALALFQAPLLYGHALLAAVHGDDDTAQRAAAEISAWASPRGMRSVQCYAWHVRALCAASIGDFAEAHRLFTTISTAGPLPQYVPQALWMIFDVVEAAVRSGHQAEADAHVQVLQARGVADVSPRLALVVSGAIAVAAPPAEAGPLFEAALATPGAPDWAFDYARIRLSYGEHLRRRRRPTLARAELSQALQDLRELAAWPWVERAEGELRAAGTGPAQPAGPLTPQQYEIATLAAAGLTNKQIAERLLLSPRTVAAHLRQVFPKLGVGSRTALRDALHKVGSQAPPGVPA